MPGRVEPVADRESEVVDVEFDECALQRRRATQVEGEAICLELEAATECGHTERQHLQGKQQFNNSNTVLYRAVGAYKHVMLFTSLYGEKT